MTIIAGILMIIMGIAGILSTIFGIVGLLKYHEALKNNKLSNNILRKSPVSLLIALAIIIVLQMILIILTMCLVGSFDISNYINISEYIEATKFLNILSGGIRIVATIFLVLIILIEGILVFLISVSVHCTLQILKSIRIQHQLSKQRYTFTCVIYIINGIASAYMLIKILGIFGFLL